jgi:hypothetical protein
VAVGDPANLYPPDQVDAIRAGIESQGGFLPFVFGTNADLTRPEAMRAAMTRYTRGLASHHEDRTIDG